MIGGFDQNSDKKIPPLHNLHDLQVCQKCQNLWTWKFSEALSKIILALAQQALIWSNLRCGGVVQQCHASFCHNRWILIFDFSIKRVFLPQRAEQMCIMCIYFLSLLLSYIYNSLLAIQARFQWLAIPTCLGLKASARHHPESHSYMLSSFQNEH